MIEAAFRHFFIFFDIGIHVRQIPRRFSIKDWLCCNPFCIANDLRINYVMDLSFGSAADLSLFQFFFHQLCHVDCQKNESCSTNKKSLFFYLLFFLVFLYFQSDLDLRET